MALSERTVLRSVTVGFDPQYVSVKEVNQILKDDVVLTESPHITMYEVTDYARFHAERPELAQKVVPILGWTPIMAAEALAARVEQVRIEQEKGWKPPVAEMPLA